MVELLRQLETSSSCQGYSLISFLTLPLQRVTRLPLLVQAILRKLPDQSSLEYHEATAALNALQQVYCKINDSLKTEFITLIYITRIGGIFYRCMISSQN